MLAASATDVLAPAPRPVSEPAAAKAAPRPEAETQSCIGSGMSIVGKIECNGPAQVFGRIEGELQASDLLIGNGAQSEFQAIGFHRLLGIRELRLYDVDAAATAKLERNLRASGCDFETVRARSAAEAAHGADILTTVTADKRNAVIVTPAMVAAGMNVNAIGGDCPGKTELHRDVLLRGDARVVVEYEPQSRIEGEVQQLPADFPVTEFARIVRGEAPGRASADEVTIFDSVGFALEDFSALRYLHRQLRARSEAPQRIDLIPALDDPKNLFALVDRRAGERLRRVV